MKQIRYCPSIFRAFCGVTLKLSLVPGPVLQLKAMQIAVVYSWSDVSQISIIPPPSIHNHLINYLRTMIHSTAIDRIIADYRIASTPDQAIILLQLDTAGQCRTGKIMHYNPSTGKRIKDETIPGRINWLHTTLKRRHQLPKDWLLAQCLFGEHLLPQYPDKTVALVESENDRHHLRRPHRPRRLADRISDG